MPITPSDLDRNRFLDRFAVGAFSTGTGGDGVAGFLARQMFPVIPSDDEVGKYFTIDFDDVRRDTFKPRAPGDIIPTGNWRMSSASFATEQYAYAEGLPEEFTAKTAPSLDVEQSATLVCAERALISQEVRFGAAYWKTGVWGIDMAGQATADATHYVFWNRAAATPVDDAADLSTSLKLKGNRRPNTLALGSVVRDRLINNAQIVGRLNNGQTPGGPAEATLADLAKLFKVQRVIVADGTYNSANEGATASNGFILNSKSAWLGYVDPNPTKFTATAGATFTWKGIAGNDQGVRMFRRWDADRRRWLIEMLHDDVYKIISANTGAFLSGIVE